MSTDAGRQAPKTMPLPDDPVVLRQMVTELLTTVTQLRTTIDQQQAHIQTLVRMTFGRRSERVEGPTLFDLTAPVVESAPAPAEPPAREVIKRRGHGRRKRPVDLPRQREVLDFSEAEKTCPCCGELRECIGTDVSERLDYQPASLFLRVIERPTYVCRQCEQRGD